VQPFSNEKVKNSLGYPVSYSKKYSMPSATQYSAPSSALYVGILGFRHQKVLDAAGNSVPNIEK